MRTILAFIAILIGLFLAWPAAAEQIGHFDVTVAIAPDGTLTVVESIVYDFEGQQRHGIFRTIPYRYSRNGFTYNARLAVQSVTDGEGGLYQHEVSRSGGAVSIKIGDPDVFVTGIQTYVIRYTVERAINWFDGEPEVYWNVTGTDWPVAIATASVTLAGQFDFRADKTVCFTGAFGGQARDCLVETSEPDSIYVATTGGLSAYQGLTVATRLPLGSIPEPSPLDRLLQIIQDNWALLLPVVVFLLLWYLYRRFGRDPKGRGTIIAEYKPPSTISPAMLGYLIDEKIDPRDVSAAIIQLAVKGYLKIHYQDKTFGHTYRLERLKKSDYQLTAFESALLEAIFAKSGMVELKDLKKTLPLKLKELKSDLEKEAQTQQYFAAKPKDVRTSYVTIGVSALVGGFFIVGGWTALGIALILSGALFLGFAPAMPRRTERGVFITEQIKGFKEFLTVTEKDRVKFHQAPVKKPEQFFSYLPFAIALAVEKDWAKQFKDITIDQPDWYTGQDWTLFNAYVFASAMSDFSNTTRSQAIAPPSSGAGAGSSGFGGGGFSGGGFGGGGGGSW